MAGAVAPLDQDRTDVNGEDRDRRGGRPRRTVVAGGRRHADGQEAQHGEGGEGREGHRGPARGRRVGGPDEQDDRPGRDAGGLEAAVPEAEGGRAEGQGQHEEDPEERPRRDAQRRVRGHGHEEEVGHETERAAEAEAAGSPLAPTRVPAQAWPATMRSARPVTTARAGSSATVPLASIHQLPRTIQERKPPATLSAGQPRRGRLDEEARVQDGEKQGEAEERPRGDAVAGEVEEKEERGDQHDPSGPLRLERATEAPGQDRHAQVGEPEDRVEGERGRQPLGRQVASRPDRLRDQHEEGGDEVEAPAPAPDRDRRHEREEGEGGAEERRAAARARARGRTRAGSGHQEERRREGRGGEDRVRLAAHPSGERTRPPGRERRRRRGPRGSRARPRSCRSARARPRRRGASRARRPGAGGTRAGPGRSREATASRRKRKPNRMPKRAP